MELSEKLSMDYLKEKIEDLFYDVESKYLFTLNWLRYRTTRRYHIVDTYLQPGYYDADERILNSNFSILVDFIEIEKAWMNTWSDRSKYCKLSWFDKKFRRFRSPEDGISYLNWEIEHTEANQAKAAKEMMDLYTWWKVTRPNREYPFVVSGYYDLFPDNSESDNFFDRSNILSSKKAKAVFKKIRKIEDGYDKEDENMLIRLMKVRKSMWT